jgi:hypothetical protein
MFPVLYTRAQKDVGEKVVPPSFFPPPALLAAADGWKNESSFLGFPSNKED